MTHRWEVVEDAYYWQGAYINRATGRICGVVRGTTFLAPDWSARIEKADGSVERLGRYLTVATAQRAVEAYWRPRDAGAIRPLIDERKCAAFIRHFGTKVEGEDAYVLEIPLAERVNVPEGTRVISADNLGSKSKVGPTVAYITFVEPASHSAAEAVRTS